VTASILKTAPFADDEVELINWIVVPASPVQRAWLARFLAGLDQTAGASGLTAQAQTAEPLTIVFASESGNSEKLAADIAKEARKFCFKPRVLDMADLQLADLASTKCLVIIAATWGKASRRLAPRASMVN
jgi:sulfite reductase (NADPH) flavoprotein alpha-component